MRWSVRGRGRSVVLAAGLSLLIGARFGFGEPGTELVVVRDGTSHSVPVSRGHGYPAVAGPDLAEALGYTWLHGDMMFEGARVRFQEGSPFFVVDSVVHQLANPVYRRNNALMIPASWALDWLPRNRPERWDNMDGRLVARGTPIALRRPADRKWLVVIDPLETETAHFWENHGEFNNVDPKSIQTEVISLPATAWTAPLTFRVKQGTSTSPPTRSDGRTSASRGSWPGRYRTQK